MYTRRYDDHRPPPDGYSGTFMSNKPPEPPPTQMRDCRPEVLPEREPTLHCGDTAETPVSCQGPPPEPTCNTSFERQYESDCDRPNEGRGGLLSGLFSRFSRGFELDDLLLLGLLLLLLGERDGKNSNSDELLLVIGLLFFMGF